METKWQNKQLLCISVCMTLPVVKYVLFDQLPYYVICIQKGIFNVQISAVQRISETIDSRQCPLVEHTLKSNDTFLYLLYHSEGVANWYFYYLDTCKNLYISQTIVKVWLNWYFYYLDTYDKFYVFSTIVKLWLIGISTIWAPIPNNFVLPTQNQI